MSNQSVHTPVLQVNNIFAGYHPDLPIVQGASAYVNKGEFVTIIGPNGAGKSTFIKAIAGVVNITSGEVLVNGKNITNIETHNMASAAIAYVPQTANVFTSLTIDENLRLGASALPKAEAAHQIAKAYADFPDLMKHKNSKAGVLSGGQRQMLAVARALLTSPDLLILDEPSAGLSPLMVNDVFTRLQKLVASGVTILMVEQNVKAALAIGDRTYVLADGKNRIDGKSADLAANEEVTAIYLGKGGRKS